MINIKNLNSNHLAPSFTKINSSKIYNMYLDEWCIDKKKNIIFLCITKCASTSLKKCLEQIEYEITIYDRLESDIAKYKNVQFYSIIREPESRYISGLNFFINRYFQGNNLNLIEQNLNKEKFIFDEHTLCQHYFLDKIIKHHNVNLIRLDKNINEKISDILGVNVSLPRLNSLDEQKNNYTEFCKDMYKKYCVNNENYLNLYDKDYSLYNSSI
jgi:hypothetical protein